MASAQPLQALGLYQQPVPPYRNSLRFARDTQQAYRDFFVADDTWRGPDITIPLLRENLGIRAKLPLEFRLEGGRWTETLELSRRVCFSCDAAAMSGRGGRARRLARDFVALDDPTKELVCCGADADDFDYADSNAFGADRAWFFYSWPDQHDTYAARPPSDAALGWKALGGPANAGGGTMVAVIPAAEGQYPRTSVVAKHGDAALPMAVGQLLALTDAFVKQCEENGTTSEEDEANAPFLFFVSCDLHEERDAIAEDLVDHPDPIKAHDVTFPLSCTVTHPITGWYVVVDFPIAVLPAGVFVWFKEDSIDSADSPPTYAVTLGTLLNTLETAVATKDGRVRLLPRGSFFVADDQSQLVDFVAGAPLLKVPLSEVELDEEYIVAQYTNTGWPDSINRVVGSQFKFADNTCPTPDARYALVMRAPADDMGVIAARYESYLFHRRVLTTASLAAASLARVSTHKTKRRAPLPFLGDDDDSDDSDSEGGGHEAREKKPKRARRGGGGDDGGAN